MGVFYFITKKQKKSLYTEQSNITAGKVPALHMADLNSILTQYMAPEPCQDWSLGIKSGVCSVYHLLWSPNQTTSLRFQCWKMFNMPKVVWIIKWNLMYYLFSPQVLTNIVPLYPSSLHIINKISIIIVVILNRATFPRAHSIGAKRSPKLHLTGLSGHLI